MPSQEDYLDNLLKNLAQGGEKKAEENRRQEAVTEPEDSIPVMEEPAPEDSVSAMEELALELGGGIPGVEEEPAPEDSVSAMEELALELGGGIPGVEEEPEPEDSVSAMEELALELGGGIPGVEEEPEPEDSVPAMEELAPEPEEPWDNAFSEEEEPEEKTVSDSSDQTPNLDTVMEMTEDEIEKLLSGGAEQQETEEVSTVDYGQDVLSMLDRMEGSGDGDLRDIQDMLQKADNNEAVDDEIVALLHKETENEEKLEDKILGENGAGTEEERASLIGAVKSEKALEKKRQKEEKAAARKAAREAAKQEKAARKKAKKKKRIHQDVQDIPVQNEEGEELLFDVNELDSLVRRAEHASRQAAREEEDEQGGDEDRGEQPGDELGVDFDHLFGGAKEDSAFLDEAAEEEDEASGVEIKEKGEKEKKNFFSKLLSFLMEEDSEEENEEIRLSKENQEILEDLDKEGKSVKGGRGGGKAGKKDKKKDKKEKKPEKPQKPKKAPKPKKEKPPKEPEPYVPPRRRLTFKKALPVILLGVTVGVALMVLVNVSADFADKHAAKNAFYRGDYETCFINLYGKELSETESVMYGKSESILYIKLWYREYEMFVEEGSEIEALDSLIQTVKDYPGLYEYASRWNAGGEVYAVYAEILNILMNKYGITELQAMEIAKVRDDVEYTRRVAALAEGQAYGSWETPGTPTRPDDSLQHKLPEESELGQGSFVDNQ